MTLSQKEIRDFFPYHVTVITDTLEYHLFEMKYLIWYSGNEIHHWILLVNAPVNKHIYYYITVFYFDNFLNITASFVIICI